MIHYEIYNQFMIIGGLIWAVWAVGQYVGALYKWVKGVRETESDRRK